MSDSLGGTAKTLMFVNVSPTNTNLDETQVSFTIYHCGCPEKCFVCKNENEMTQVVLIPKLCWFDSPETISVPAELAAVRNARSHNKERCDQEREQQGRAQAQAAAGVLERAGRASPLLSLSWLICPQQAVPAHCSCTPLLWIWERPILYPDIIRTLHRRACHPSSARMLTLRTSLRSARRGPRPPSSRDSLRLRI